MAMTQAIGRISRSSELMAEVSQSPKLFSLPNAFQSRGVNSPTLNWFPELRATRKPFELIGNPSTPLVNS
nr:hypothetical protein Itr_chr05CG15680 [Ipomoea trifida]